MLSLTICRHFLKCAMSSSEKPAISFCANFFCSSLPSFITGWAFSVQTRRHFLLSPFTACLSTKPASTSFSTWKDTSAALIFLYLHKEAGAFGKFVGRSGEDPCGTAEVFQQMDGAFHPDAGGHLKGDIFEGHGRTKQIQQSKGRYFCAITGKYFRNNAKLPGSFAEMRNVCIFALPKYRSSPGFGPGSQRRHR